MPRPASVTMWSAGVLSPSHRSFWTARERDARLAVSVTTRPALHSAWIPGRTAGSLVAAEAIPIRFAVRPFRGPAMLARSADL